jgi:PTS system N-acetylglucosamine-specific IIC component
MILPAGAVMFAIYYAVFRWFIVRFNVPTPGRAAETEGEAGPVAAPSNDSEEAAALIAALGGAGNLLEIDACATRLRLRVASQETVDEGRLKALGAAGVLRPTADTLQVVMGLRADAIASEMQRVAAAGETPPADVLVNALGGAANILEREVFGPRLAVLVRDESAVNEEALLQAGFRGLARLGDGRVQVLAAREFPAGG